MSRKGHFDGKRKAGTHTTITDESQKVIDLLLSTDCPCSSLRVSPGVIRHASPGKMRVKTELMTVGSAVVGLKITVRGVTGVQDLRVVNTQIPDSVKSFLDRKFAG